MKNVDAINRPRPRSSSAWAPQQYLGIGSCCPRAVLRLVLLYAPDTNLYSFPNHAVAVALRYNQAIFSFTIIKVNTVKTCAAMGVLYLVVANRVPLFGQPLYKDTLNQSLHLNKYPVSLEHQSRVTILSVRIYLMLSRGHLSTSWGCPIA